MPKKSSTTTSKADPKRQARRVARALSEVFPEPECALHFRNPFELLVATILSAQCTDKKVNEVTPALFARYPDAMALADAKTEDLEKLIHATGFFRAKAKNLRGMASALVERHGGLVPQDVEALTALPGVGRKTANVVLGTAFGIASGVVVDTHVKRLASRMGLTTSDDPEKIAGELEAAVPRCDWIAFGHRMILHGRSVCTASRPKCEDCRLVTFCPRVGVVR